MDDKLKTKATRITMTNAETIQAGILLQTHLHKMEGTDFYAYDAGWSDETIANTVGRIDSSHIMRLRLTLGMKVQVRTAGTNARLEELIVNHNRLCDMLSVNKVIDVRHLKIN